mmetsp:Transcript_40026/g.105933  ORF Transcript_40026/g.105933 Transcript_40026/m.105933 type:complete len:294 (-) Transcript_40026:1295-2176(-)
MEFVVSLVPQRDRIHAVGAASGGKVHCRVSVCREGRLHRNFAEHPLAVVLQQEHHGRLRVRGRQPQPLGLVRKNAVHHELAGRPEIDVALDMALQHRARVVLRYELVTRRHHGGRMTFKTLLPIRRDRVCDPRRKDIGTNAARPGQKAKLVAHVSRAINERRQVRSNIFGDQRAQERQHGLRHFRLHIARTEREPEQLQLARGLCQQLRVHLLAGFEGKRHQCCGICETHGEPCDGCVVDRDVDLASAHLRGACRRLPGDRVRAAHEATRHFAERSRQEGAEDAGELGPRQLT